MVAARTSLGVGNRSRSYGAAHTQAANRLGCGTKPVGRLTQQRSARIGVARRPGGTRIAHAVLENGKPVASNKREIPDPALAHENRLKMAHDALRYARCARRQTSINSGAARARSLSAFRDAYLVYSSA